MRTTPKTAASQLSRSSPALPRERSETVCIVTANVGGVDDLKLPCAQDHAHDYFAYTERNLPFPLPNLNNRLRGKYIKIQSHRFLPHNAHIWIDGNVEIISTSFVSEFTRHLEDSDIVICLHPRRLNPYEEIEFILKEIESGNSYLTERYGNEPLREELAFFRAEGLPDNVPLYACRLFARKNVPKVNACFDDWWRHILEFSNFDQTMFSYIVWKHELRVTALDFRETLKRSLKLHEHRSRHS